MLRKTIYLLLVFWTTFSCTKTSEIYRDDNKFSSGYNFLKDIQFSANLFLNNELKSTFLLDSLELDTKDLLLSNSRIYLENSKNKGVARIKYYGEDGEIISSSDLSSLVKLVNPTAFYDAFRQIFSQAEIEEFKADCEKYLDPDYNEFDFCFRVMANKQGKIEELTIEIPDVPSTRKINPDRLEELESILKSTIRYEYPQERLKFLKYLNAGFFTIYGSKL